MSRIEREVAGWMHKTKEFESADIILIGLGVVDLFCLYRLMTA